MFFVFNLTIPGNHWSARLNLRKLLSLWTSILSGNLTFPGNYWVIEQVPSRKIGQSPAITIPTDLLTDYTVRCRMTKSPVLPQYKKDCLTSHNCAGSLISYVEMKHQLFKNLHENADETKKRVVDIIKISKLFNKIVSRHAQSCETIPLVCVRAAW